MDSKLASTYPWGNPASTTAIQTPPSKFNSGILQMAKLPKITCILPLKHLHHTKESKAPDYCHIDSQAAQIPDTVSYTVNTKSQKVHDHQPQGKNHNLCLCSTQMEITRGHTACRSTVGRASVTVSTQNISHEITALVGPTGWG